MSSQQLTIFTFYTQQRVLQATTWDKGIAFVVHSPFFSPQKKIKNKTKKEQEGEEKLGQRQLNSQI